MALCHGLSMVAGLSIEQRIVNEIEIKVPDIYPMWYIVGRMLPLLAKLKMACSSLDN